MTVSTELDRALADFLEEGPAQLPDRAYDAVIQRIPRTRQRVVLGPWREPLMLRLAAVLAVALAAVLAAVGSGALTSLQTTPSPTPAASASTLDYVWPGPLRPGTYTTSMIWDTPFAFTFTLPEGWQARDVEVIKDPVSRVNEVGGPRGMSVAFSLIDNVYADPCAATPSDPGIGPSVDEAAAALAALPGAKATSPVPMTFAGRDAIYLELTIDADAPCAGADYHLWSVDPAWYRPAEHVGPPFFTAERERYRIWLLDIDGWRLLIAALAAADATPADLSEQQAIVDSIRIGPPVRESTRGACPIEFLAAAAPGGPVERPFVVTMVDWLFPLRGPAPEPFPITPPAAQLDFTAGGTGWGDRPGIDLVPPVGSTRTGFATTTGVEGLQGSFVFDAPGTWWIRVGRETCVQQHPVQVLAPR